MTKKKCLFGDGINSLPPTKYGWAKKSQEVGVVEAMKNVGKTNWEWETNGENKTAAQKSQHHFWIFYDF